MSFEKKIDLILCELESIETRLDNINRKVNSLSARIDVLEHNFETKNEEIGSLLSGKADLTSLNQMNHDIGVYDRII